MDKRWYTKDILAKPSGRDAHDVLLEIVTKVTARQR